MPVTTIYLSTTTGGSDHILSGGMISTDFLLFFFTVFGFFGYFFMFFVFLGCYTTFCLVFYISLSVFGHKPLRERGNGRSPHPSVLTKLKSYSR